MPPEKILHPSWPSKCPLPSPAKQCVQKSRAPFAKPSMNCHYCGVVVHAPISVSLIFLLRSSYISAIDRQNHIPPLSELLLERVSMMLGIQINMQKEREKQREKHRERRNKTVTPWSNPFTPRAGRRHYKLCKTMKMWVNRDFFRHFFFSISGE